MKQVAELTVRLFNLVTFVHLEHFKTASYAAHKALEDLYEALPDLIDAYVEHYQGEHGKIGAYPGSWAPVSKGIEPLIKSCIDFIDSNYDALTGGNPVLENDLADVSGELYRALYRLKELS